MQNINVYYYDHFCLLVVNSKGKIKKLYTPFRVLCIRDIDQLPGFKKGLTFYVDEVWESLEDKLIYLIYRNKIPYSYFQLFIRF